MKRFLCLIVVLGIVLSASAEILNLKAYQLSVKYENNDWSEWDNCDVKIDVINNIINVYIEGPRSYILLHQIDTEDNTLKFEAVDNYNLHCSIVFRHIDSVLQMYIIYADVSVVYNIILIE